MTETALFVFLVCIYAAVLGVGSWCVMRAEHRSQWQAKAQEAKAGIGNWLGVHRTHLTTRISRIPPLTLRVLKGTRKLLNRRKRSLALVLLLLAAPAAVLHLTASDTLEPYSDLPPATDPVIMALLKGEQLVPPPPLPPEAFITQEIEADRRDLLTASREWRALDVDFRQRLLAVYRRMAQHGYHMALLEGYRSPERQTALASRGQHVTQAGAYQSYHQYGLAADSAFYREGKIVISEKDPWALKGYRLYGQYAESVGLVWGGRWKLMDFGHVELRGLSPENKK